MGVSKPILKHVIFCHQEEANWPVQGGKDLKDMFDKIFESSKYNEAMDAITKLIKDLKQNLIIIETEVRGYQRIVDEIECKKRELNSKKSKVSIYQSKISQIKINIKPTDLKLNDLLEQEKKYKKLEDIKRKITFRCK